MPTPTSSAFGREGFSRFNFLLQPIRDLTKNWDIEVAPLLEEYLNEIEKIEISFDGGTTTMNFAEAALLIQGSACIYSKKVEYLYTLVYQTLDLIASKKRLQQASSVDEQGQDKDVTTRAQDEEMNTCTVHASGALLLDLGNLMLVDHSFTQLPTSTPQIHGPAQGTPVDTTQQPVVNGARFIGDAGPTQSWTTTQQALQESSDDKNDDDDQSGIDDDDGDESSIDDDGDDLVCSDSSDDKNDDNDDWH
ncbi:hypothetical protein QZH41_019035 [Actinostola sp. cb2023]|nr:hypothetical protein QZH41_019035 [Actinostola sp. cb2023]